MMILLSGFKGGDNHIVNRKKCEKCHSYHDKLLRCSTNCPSSLSQPERSTLSQLPSLPECGTAV